MAHDLQLQIEPLEFDYATDQEWETGSPNRSSRDYIKWVQQSLNQIMGLHLAVDGISGTQTRSAVRSFQQQHGLAVDGIVGSQTERALITAGAGNPPGVVPSPSVPSQPSPGATPSASWVLPPDVRAAGERQLVRYDSPPPWDNGKNCTGSLTSGAADLRDYIRATFRGTSSIGGYNCRQNTANLAETSVHGTGRALDIMIPLVNRRANSAVGDPIANWLVQNAAAIGIQYVIWNHIRWSGSRSGRKDGDYGGPSPHIDHIHVELNRDGAARSTPWFSSRTQPVVPTPSPSGFRPLPVETPGGGRIQDKRAPAAADLVTVTGVGGKRIQLHRLAADAWRAMVSAARVAGISEPLLLPTSGYRSPEYQQQLWDEALARYGSPEAARKWVAPPGSSAHQSGRAMDLYLGGKNDSGNVNSLRTLAAYKWLVANAQRFGFYPYGAEPWHWEYNPPA